MGEGDVGRGDPTRRLERAGPPQWAFGRSPRARGRAAAKVSRLTPRPARDLRARGGPAASGGAPDREREPTDVGPAKRLTKEPDHNA